MSLPLIQITVNERFHFILCVYAKNVSLLVFNKERKIKK